MVNRMDGKAAIDCSEPKSSWKLRTEKHAQSQYVILVAEGEKPQRSGSILILVIGIFEHLEPTKVERAGRQRNEFEISTKTRTLRCKLLPCQ
jgi:hypothetical protein